MILKLLIPLGALAVIGGAATCFDLRDTVPSKRLEAAPRANAPASTPARAQVRAPRSSSGDGATPPARFAARVDRDLAKTLVARALPPTGSTPSTGTLLVRSGDVVRNASNELVLVDASSDGSRGTRVELELTPDADGTPAVEARACDYVPSNPSARNDWEDLGGTLRVSEGSWKSGDELVVHYTVHGTDVAGLEREESGLLRLRVP